MSTLIKLSALSIALLIPFQVAAKDPMLQYQAQEIESSLAKSKVFDFKDTQAIEDYKKLNLKAKYIPMRVKYFRCWPEV